MTNNSLKLDNDIEIDEKDVISGVFTVDSDIYDLTIDMAYLDMSQNEAKRFHLHVVKPEKNISLKFSFTLSTNKFNGKRNYYIDQRTNKKKALPGYSQVNAISMLSVGIGLGDLKQVEKTIKVFDYDLKKEMPVNKPVFTELLGKPITLGIKKEIVNVKKQNKKTKKYEPTAKTRTINEVDRVFRTSDHLTIAEAKAKETTPKHYIWWIDNNKGVTVNNVVPVAGSDGTSGMPTPATPPIGEATETTDDLFADLE